MRGRWPCSGVGDRMGPTTQALKESPLAWAITVGQIRAETQFKLLLAIANEAIRSDPGGGIVIWLWNPAVWHTEG